MDLMLIILNLLTSINRTELVIPPPSIDSNYIAAKYSIVHENAGFPYMEQKSQAELTSYRYYIQYGKDVMIQLTDPGDVIDYMPVIIYRWDYSDNIYRAEIIFNHVFKYYSLSDSIQVSIEESQGILENYCTKEKKKTFCDSLKFTRALSKTEYLVYFKDSIPNLMAYDLFYPDMNYLPSKIVALNSRIKPKTLEEVIYGKEAIDSLLKHYSPKDYERISEEEWELNQMMFPPESFMHLVPDSMK